MSPSVVSGPPAGAQAGYQSFGVTKLDRIVCLCEMFVFGVHLRVGSVLMYVMAECEVGACDLCARVGVCVLMCVFLP